MANLGLVNEVGGIFNFAPTKPQDTAHTKEKELWKRRFRSGMCLHCGQKLFKTKFCVMTRRRKFTPLNIPGFVNNGVCVHPNCDPPKKCKADYSDQNIDITVSNDMDTLLDAVEENRNDLEQFIQEMNTTNKKHKESAAIMLEDAVMQLNRTMSQLSKEQKESLRATEKKLNQRIDEARSVLGRLDGRVTTLERQYAREKNRSDQLEATVAKLSARVEQFELGSSHSTQSLPAKSTPSSPIPANSYVSLSASQQSFHSPSSQSSYHSLPTVGQSHPSPTSPKPYVVHPSASSSTSFGSSISKPALSSPASPNPYVSPVSVRRPPIALPVFVPEQRVKSAPPPSADNPKTAPCTTTYINNGASVATGSGNVLTVSRRQPDGSYSDSFSQVLEGHRDVITCCAVANRNKSWTLVSGGKDNQVIAWRQGPSGRYQKHQHLSAQADSINCVAVSADGSLIVSGSEDKTLSIWRLQDNDQYMCTQFLTGHTKAVASCSIVDDGTTIVSKDSDGSTRTWLQQPGGLYELQ